MIILLRIIFLVIVSLFPIFLGTLNFLPQYILFSILLLFLIFNNNWIKFPYLLIPYFLFLIFSIISLSYTFSHWAGRNEILRIANYLILFYFSLVFFNDKKWQEILLNVLLVVSLIVCLYGLWIYIIMGGKNFLIFSTFFNPNCFAGYLILIIPLSIYKLITAQNFISKNRYISILIILILSLILTGSRGAMLSLFMSFFIWIFILRRNLEINKTLKFLILFFILLCSVLFITKPILQEKFFSLFDVSSRSNLYRILVYQGTLNIIKSHPITGTGIGTFETVYPNYKLGGVNTKLTHNTYLQIASELGIIGFFLFLAIFITIIKKLYSSFRKTDNKLFVSCIIFSCISFILHNIFDYTWYIPSIAGIFFIIAAVGVDSTKYKEINFKLAEQKYIAVFLFIFIVLSYFEGIKYGLAEWYNDIGEEKKEKKDFKSAQMYFSLASKLDSLCAQYYSNLGSVYLKQKKYKLALKEFQKALNLEKHSSFYHTDVAMAYLFLGERQKAKIFFEKAHKLHKTYTIPLRELGNIYLAEKKIILAKKQFEKIVKISENKYFQDKYQPLPGQKENPDFEYAKNALKILNIKLDK